MFRVTDRGGSVSVFHPAVYEQFLVMSILCKPLCPHHCLLFLIIFYLLFLHPCHLLRLQSTLTFPSFLPQLLSSLWYTNSTTAGSELLHPGLASHQLSLSAILSLNPPFSLRFSLNLAESITDSDRCWIPSLLLIPLSLFDSLRYPCSLFYWWKFVQQALTQMLNGVCRTQFSLPPSLSLSLSLHLCGVSAKLLLSLNGRSKHSQSLAHESKSPIIIHCIMGCHWGGPVWRVTSS